MFLPGTMFMNFYAHFQIRTSSSVDMVYLSIAGSYISQMMFDVLLQEGLGRFPKNIKSVADAMLFNSLELPYHL